VDIVTRSAWRRSPVLLVLALAGLLIVCGPALAQRPDAELKGITTVGVLVEPLGPAATTCGFSREMLEQALTRMLTAGGLKAVPHKSEDTYIDVRVETLNVQAGVCVSRFDTTVFTTTTARLSYQSQPVPVHVSLLHAAGLSGGGVTGHSANVLRSIQQKVEEFTSRIRAASR
jgi:hypothetical protein